jgi:quercetin dioxygenase-like cupin family protein
VIISYPGDDRRAPGKSSQFTGVALGDAVMPSTDGVTINTVSFEPGARTHWHEHERGQLLFVLSGYGLICSQGEASRMLRAGTWVWIPPGERHWHGATPDSFFTHTAVSFGITAWSDPVAEDDYATPTERNDHDH